MARKTIDVSTIREWANNYMACENVSDEGRLGVFAIASQTLLETGNYRGFRYVNQEWDEDNQEMVIPNETMRELY